MSHFVFFVVVVFTGGFPHLAATRLPSYFSLLSLVLSVQSLPAHLLFQAQEKIAYRGRKGACASCFFLSTLSSCSLKTLLEALFSVRFAYWGAFFFFSCVYLCVWLSSRSSSREKKKTHTHKNNFVNISAFFVFFFFFFFFHSVFYCLSFFFFFSRIRRRRNSPQSILCSRTADVPVFFWFFFFPPPLSFT